MSFYEKDKPTNKKSFNVKLKKQHKRCFIHFSHLLVSTGLIFYLTPSWRTRFVLLTNKIRMFVTIGYASGASEDWPLFARIFKFSKSNSNVCYDTLRSTYKWKWDFNFRKFTQVLPVSAVNSADLHFRAMSVYTSARL